MKIEKVSVNCVVDVKDNDGTNNKFDLQVESVDEKIETRLDVLTDDKKIISQQVSVNKSAVERWIKRIDDWFQSKLSTENKHID